MNRRKNKNEMKKEKCKQQHYTQKVTVFFCRNTLPKSQFEVHFWNKTSTTTNHPLYAMLLFCFWHFTLITAWKHKHRRSTVLPFSFSKRAKVLAMWNTFVDMSGENCFLRVFRLSHIYLLWCNDNAYTAELCNKFQS